MNWIYKLWYARLRRIDLKILWPVCKQKAEDLDHAKAAFAVHAFNDEAWKFLSHDEIVKRIDVLD